MTYVLLYLQVILFSLSGVMLPGPMTAVAIQKGSKSPTAGIFFAIGHGIVEIPLIVIIYFGFVAFFKIILVKILLGITGGIILFIIAIDMFKNVKIKEDEKGENLKSPVILGIILSIGNPAFLVWWATLGADLIINTVTFGILSLILFIIIHLLCDFLWLSFLSIVSYKGKQFFGSIFQRIIFIVCGTLILFFSIKYFYESFILVWKKIF